MPTKKEHLMMDLLSQGIHLVNLNGPDDGPSDQISINWQVGYPQGDEAVRAQAIINAFDWSEQNHANWILGAERLLQIEKINELQNMTLRSIVKLSVDQFNLLRGEVIAVVTANWDPANMNNGAGVNSPTVNVPNVKFGDELIVCPPYALTGVIAFASVQTESPADGQNGTVMVRLQNFSGSAVNLPNGAWKIVVRRTVARSQITMPVAKAAIMDDINQGRVDS